MSLYTSTLKQVLVAVDLSNEADHALQRALQLAAAHGAEANVVYVMDEGLPAEAQAEVTANSESVIRAKLTASPFVDQVKVTIDLVVGNAETDIVERAVMTNADCIVLGLHDRLLPENLPIEGTLAEAIIGASQLPVLLVRNEPRGPYQTVVVGIDFSPLSHPAVQAAVLIAPEATLHLVHAYEGENDEARAAEQKLKSFVPGESQVFERAALMAGLPRIAVKSVAEQGNPREALKTQIQARGADLLVLGTRGRTGLARTLLGSVTTDMINARLCDVLVIRPK
jgi:nucleotide-binding universal stress UspA family protein